VKILRQCAIAHVKSHANIRTLREIADEGIVMYAKEMKLFKDKGQESKSQIERLELLGADFYDLIRNLCKKKIHLEGVIKTFQENNIDILEIVKRINPLGYEDSWEVETGNENNNNNE
jgi:hypothetical protein